MDSVSANKDVSIERLEFLCDNCQCTLFFANGYIRLESGLQHSQKLVKSMRGTRKNLKKLYVADLCKNGELPRGLVKLTSRRHRQKSVRYSDPTPEPAQVSLERKNPSQEGTYFSPNRDNSNLNHSLISAGKTFFKTSPKDVSLALGLHQIKLLRELVDYEEDLSSSLEFSDLKSTARPEEKINARQDLSPLSIDIENHVANHRLGQFIKKEGCMTKKLNDERLRTPLQELGLPSLYSLSSQSFRW